MNSLKRILSLIKEHKRITSIGIVILVVLIFIFRPQPLKPIETQKVEKTNFINSVSVTGTINSSKVANLSFQIAGKLVYLGVKKGDNVTAYQTIAAIDSRTAQKNLENVLLDYSLRRNNFDQTQDDNQNRKPYQALNDKMKRILEDNQFNLDKAVKSVELQSLANELSFLITPISGIVIRADTQSPGVNITSSTIFSIADSSNLVFDMDVDEADVGKIKTGQEVDINLDAYPEKTLKINVSKIDFASHTNSTGSNVFTVEGNISQTDDSSYRVGMNGDAQIITQKKESVLIIPNSSIIDSNFVYLKTKKGFEKKKIKIAGQNDTQTEVVEGLSINDEVALQPAKVPQNTQRNIPIIGRFLRSR